VQFLTSAANELRPRAARFSAWRSPGALLLIGIACLWALPFAASPAQALCTPPAGPGTPAAGTTVTCFTVTNQNPGVIINGGTANDGYGDANQTGLTINVQPSQVVTGFYGGPVPPFITANGIAVGNGNTINLLSGTASTRRK